MILATICVHSEQMHTNQSQLHQASCPAQSPQANGLSRAAAERHLHQPSQVEAQKPCQHCGGSGMLRKDGESFRTCLECLGQGMISNSNGLLFSRIRPASSPAASR